jgi:hypothetical protein
VHQRARAREIGGRVQELGSEDEEATSEGLSREGRLGEGRKQGKHTGGNILKAPRTTA